MPRITRPETYADYCAIETQAGRALRAVRQIADESIADNVRHAEFVLAAVRAASQFLGDDKALAEYAASSGKTEAEAKLEIADSLVTQLFGRRAALVAA